MRPANDFKHVFLDLDGTLLSASLGFRAGALTYLAARLVTVFGVRRTLPYCKRMYRALMNNTPDSGRTNFERMVFEGMAASGVARGPIVDALAKFYDRDFPKLRRFTWPTPGALTSLEMIESRGWPMSIVTNPIWPLRCVEKRLEWAGLDPGRFTMITHSEIMHACKPRAEFYRECLDRLALLPSQAIMIGNDIVKDGSAGLAGIATLLLRNDSWPKTAELGARLDQLNGSGSAVDDDFLPVTNQPGHSRNI